MTPKQFFEAWVKTCEDYERCCDCPLEKFDNCNPPSLMDIDGLLKAVCREAGTDD